MKIPLKLFSGRIVQQIPEKFLSGAELILKSTINRVISHPPLPKIASYCYLSLWLGLEHLKAKNCFLNGPISFHCFIDYLILRNVKITDIANLPRKKIFLDFCILVYCSYLAYDSQKCIKVCCTKWAKERHNANSARPSGLAKWYHPPELSVFVTSRLKIKLIPE